MLRKSLRVLLCKLFGHRLESAAYVGPTGDIVKYTICTRCDLKLPGHDWTDDTWW